MPQGDIYQLTIFYTLVGQSCNNVLHFYDDGTGGTAASLLSSFDNFISNNLRLVQSTDLAYVKLRAQQIFPIYRDPEEITVTQATGSVAQESLPSTVALVWSIRTGTASRRRRGRIFWPGATEGQHQGSKLTSAAETLWNTCRTAFEGLYLGLTGGSSPFAIGVWSRTLAGSPPFNANAFAPATSITVQPIFATQRRRRIGVGS